MIRWRPISHCYVCCDMLLLSIILVLHYLSLPIVCPQNTYLRSPIIGITTDRACQQRPPGCELHCPFGYRAAASGNCLCTCHDDPCLVCAPSEYCRRNNDGSAFCVSQIVSQLGRSGVIVKPGECPRLVGGACIQRCSSDGDCSGALKCCSNGCGRECVVALSPLPLVNSLSIHPLQATGHFSRIGNCPLKNYIKNRKCMLECTHDEECPWVEKCCDNGCGRVCTPPDKATDCVHLISAISRLPEKTLANGYVPKCTADGKFENIQCDNSNCWCVDEKGIEVTGTKTLKETSLPNCLRRRNCPGKLCTKLCQFGMKTDEDGCPLDTCECRNICDGVKCTGDIDVCQMVEPECAQPPCLPVPRCLLNPCPNGSPMTLSNGVTALCTHTSQCSPNYWCHQIGFNGLGFCCALPESVIHGGSCVPSFSRSGEHCESECRIDSDCSAQAKCCFDGCSLKCMLEGAQVDWSTEQSIVAEEQLISKGTKVKQIGECPQIPQHNDPEKCLSECKTDQDCTGVRKCCAYGCSTLCLFPAKATACLHEVITHEIYEHGRKPKCNDQGNYEQIQCDDDICYCVDTINGSEIPATRTTSHTEPVCNERRLDCESFRCPKICPHGFEITQEGCLSCECRNPCKSIPCPQGYVCVMASVECLENIYCPDQPRCVPDVCSSDASSNSLTPPILCESELNCPNDYWCNNIGIQSKGLCCLKPWKQLHDGPKCKSIEPFIERSEPCTIHCRADDGCAPGSKCCYDGCGTMCFPVTGISTSVMITDSTTAGSDVTLQIGKCPPIRPRTDCEFLATPTCKSDSNCPELQKCCMTACGKRCSYPEQTTGCLQMKIAHDKLGKKNAVRCNEDGQYEDIQCDDLYCWCVSKTGSELEGTKVSSNLTPNCRARRLCPLPHCSVKRSCAYGFETDNNGCATCKCFNPCKGITCPNKKEVCIPQLVDCTDNHPCRAVPNCAVNACPQGIPVTDEATFEPLSCNNNAQCSSLGTPSFCHNFRNSGGYCCWGTEPTRNPGSCPAVTESGITNCSISCTIDEECSTATEKCCFNGCGLSCLASEQASPPGAKETKLGECPQISDHSAGCTKNEVDECTEDSDCRTVQKCCSNGCRKLCTYPEATTACLHLLGASEISEPGSYVPQCDASGNFVRIQKVGTLFWCVDETGHEIHGTRTSQPNPNCDVPRSCPLLNCKLDCPLGFEMDQNGCDQCRCRNPCKNVRCPSTHVCRLVDVKCLSGKCDPIPKCILNVCPKGEPLTLPNVHHMVLCNTNENRQCPVSYFCHQVGIPLLESAYCCVGNEISRAVCPSTFEISYTDSKLCTIQCHTHNDCLSGKCCFNGCGTSCLDLQTKESSIDRDSIPNFPKALHGEFEKLGSCLVSDVSDSSCRSDCRKDIDCPGFQKCCTMGCSNTCVFPHVATACIHKLAAYNGEDKKMPSDGPRIECNEDGTFKNVQCDQQIRQCWCVDPETGEELHSTRVMAATAKPNCQASTSCSTVCDQIKCEHGVRLDANGCPLNGFCECKNPCEEIKCAKEEDICVLMPVKCIASPCPSVPQCKPNPCPKDSEALRDRNGNVFSCVQNEDCGRGSCKLLSNEQSHGICCSSGGVISERTLSNRKLGQCPVIMPSKASSSTNCSVECSEDSVCPGVQLCCDYGCNKICVYPETATSMFETIQCDEFNSCWCVNAVTGAAVHGSRMKLLDSSLAFAYNVCTNKKSCSISCNDAICPFGIEMDADGCPRDIRCGCRNLCDAVQCSGNQMCILRRTTCSEPICIPIPSCEVNPCSGIDKPILDETTYVQLSCTENRTEICPSGYYCTGYDLVMRGVCCPGNRTDGSRQDVLSCPHGDPFSNKADGWPLKCAESGNDCPSTHYCFTAPDHLFGVCCVSKRYVCHLPLDAGPCAVNLKRYYYEYTNQTCIPFSYGGCSGNSNNFINKRDCEKFCWGSDVDLKEDFFINNGKSVEMYQLGFSLTGPLLREKHRQDINDVFREYVTKKFNIGNNELRDIVIRDDNTVQFVLRSEDAKQKAANISSAVSDGSFRFTYNGDTYRAEPHSWNSHHIEEKKASSGMLFLWVLIGVSLVFAIIIVTSLFYACCFLYKKSKENDSSRGVSPSQYVSRTGYATPTPIASSPNSGSSSEQFEQRVASENAHHHRHTMSQESDWSGVHTAPQTPGGRRRSRTTVYY